MAEELKRPSILQTEDQQLKVTTDEPMETPAAKNIDNISHLMRKLEYTPLVVNRLDYYGNAIPIGAFCNAMSFILFGFTRCHVFSENLFLQGIILIFGALGQITAGILEYLKIRSFSSLLYLTLGFYSFSHFFLEDFRGVAKSENPHNDYFGIENGNRQEEAFYYGAWFLIILPLVLASLKINVFFLIHTASTCFFFLFRWIGEVSNKKGLYDYTSGIFQLIAGFDSLYIFFYQIMNEIQIIPLPSISFENNNDIDYNIVVEQKNSQAQTTTPQ